MKKITKVIVAAAIAVAVLGGVSVIKYANTDSRQKECRKVIDGFEYQYTVQGDEGSRISDLLAIKIFWCLKYLQSWEERRSPN